MWRVLMVDDEELIRNAMSSYIEQNFEVEIYRAASGYEALSLLHKMRFDVVITDISMPMMDGIELLRNIKQIWPMCYVIVLTVYDQFEYVYKTLKYERVDYVLKAESYVGIHNALTKAFEILQRAREQERQLLRLGNHIEQMKPQMRNAVVSRLLHKQAELPPQEELEAMDFGLDTTRPVLFAVGLIDRENAAQVPIILSDFSYIVLTRMGSKETIIRNFLSDNYAVWLIQPHKHLEQTECSNFLMYARDAFEQASENLLATRNLRIPVVMVDQISQWSELADQFYHAAFVLEGMRHTNGLFLMKDFPCKPEKQIIAGLTLEDMTLLWEFLQIGKKDDFLQFMTQKLQPIFLIRDIHDAMPLALVHAMSYLYLQACGTMQQPALLPNYVQNLLDTSGHMSGRDWAAAMLKLFGDFFDHKQNAMSSGIHTIIDQIQTFVQEHFKEDIHLSSIAEVFHYSPSYLSRLYKEETNNNLSTYIIMIRLNFAKNLLRKTSMSIRDIAHESGFYSVKYFTQAFKKYNHEITPGQYRNGME